MSTRLKRCLWLVLVYFSMRGVEQSSRRPMWTRELPKAYQTEMVGWIDDDQFALVSGKWDKKRSCPVWNKLVICDQMTGQSSAEYDLPNWPYGPTRVQGQRIVFDTQESAKRPVFDLVTRRVDREPSDQFYDEVTPSGRWRLRDAGYGRNQVRNEDGPWQPWPTEEQLASWGMTQNGYKTPADRLFVYFWGLKFSPDETRVATVCEQRTPENSYGDWVGRIHAWPSGDILHEWRLGKNQRNNSFAILPLAWEGDTFFVEEVMDTIGDGNADDQLNRWFRCHVRETGVEMSVLDWTNWDDSQIGDIGSRWLQASEGDCLETYYHSKRNVPFPSWGWKYRFTRWIYGTFNPMVHDQSPLLRDTVTGQVLWQGPKQGFSRWHISRDRQFALGMPARYPQPNDRRTIALYPLVPRLRWPWHVAIIVVAVWGWRSFGKDSAGSGSATDAGGVAQPSP